MLQSSSLRFLNDRGRHGMGKMLLQAGRCAQDFIFCFSSKWNHTGHSRLRLRERSGLVKNKGVCLSHCLQIFAAFHRNLILTGFPHRRENRNGHRQLQRTGKVHHQNGQCFLHISRQKPGQDRSSEAERNETVRQRSRLSFHGRLQLFRFFDHMDNFFIPCGTGNSGDPNHDLTFLHHGSRIYNGILHFPHRYGFSGQRRLIDHSLPTLHHTIQRNQISHAHHNLIFRLHIPHRHQHFLISCLFPDLLHLQTHTSCQIVHRLFMGPFLQNLSNLQKEHYGTCCLEIPTQKRYSDRRGIQNLHFQLSGDQ